MSAQRELTVGKAADLVRRSHNERTMVTNDRLHNHRTASGTGGESYWCLNEERNAEENGR